MKAPLILLFLLIAGVVTAQNYYVYATAESEDEVALIKFDGNKAEIAKIIKVGFWPAEIEGPHGINVSPEGDYWYLSLAHGNPYGYLLKYKTGTDELVEKTTLGLFPATMDISEANGLLYCVNFNLHGDMVPSSVSVVDPESMTELKKIKTGTMPHGSRISPDGLFHYSVAMMSGELFEINTLTMEVERVLDLDKNESVSPEREMEKGKHHEHANHNMQNMDHGNMQKMDHSMHNNHAGMKHSKVKPTWVIPHPKNPYLYVAANGSDEVLEVNKDSWKIERRFTTGKAPYNIEITPDGKYFIVTYKGDGDTGIWNIKKGKEVARISNTTTVSHGVAISSDSKYAFISVEGKGGEPGKIDVIDLKKMKLASSVGIGKQAGGIIFWKID